MRVSAQNRCEIILNQFVVVKCNAIGGEPPRKNVSSALRGFATFLAVRPPSSTYHELEIAWETILEGHGTHWVRQNI